MRSVFLPRGRRDVVIRQLPSILRAQRVAVRARSYADHAESWRPAGAKVVTHFDPLALAGEADVAVIVNLNNPDGHRWTVEAIEAARATLAHRGGWLIVDEAYADLNPLSAAPLAGRKGLIICDPSQVFRACGREVGCRACYARDLEQHRRSPGGWDVSGPALDIGAAAYADHTAGRYADTLPCECRRCTPIATSALEDRGGTDLFRFVRGSDANALWRRLAEQGIAVRRFVGEAHHLRIGLPADKIAFSRLARALNP